MKDIRKLICTGVIAVTIPTVPIFAFYHLGKLGRYFFNGDLQSHTALIVFEGFVISILVLGFMVILLFLASFLWNLSRLICDKIHSLIEAGQ